jgi:SWI/SNF-related matrix-associated actin-dependent regulator of chromatin subfamily A member 5
MPAVTILTRTYPNLCFSLMIDDDIDAIISKGEERTAELNSKYEGLNFEDLSNFKSETMVQQWEGEDFQKVSS